jgi:ketosteroid isomerase-like protein
MIEPNSDPAVVAEVRAAFEAYNAALGAGDVDALNGHFWNSPSTVRFGPTENLFGFEEISAFRSGRWQKTEGARVVERVVVTAFGRDLATTNALIRGSDASVSRQSQTWARLRDGWRIVAAHVSRSPV